MVVLLTSAGRRVELLLAFRQALHKLGLSGRILASDANPLAPALSFADGAHIVPRIDHSEYVGSLCGICAREGVDLVVPLIDPDVEVLARNRARLEQAGSQVAVVGAEASEITADKWLTAAFFARSGVPTPATFLASEVPGDLTFPLFIKPRRGSASAYTFKVHDQREFNFFRHYVPDPLVQEFLPGPEITTDVICDLNGSLLGLVSRQRIEVRGGEVSKGITVRNATIDAHVERIVEALPARGPITVQCMMLDGHPRFTEINARFGGGVPLGIAAGVDSPALLLEELVAPGKRPRGLPEYEVGLYLSRFDQSVFIPKARHEYLAGHRI